MDKLTAMYEEWKAGLNWTPDPSSGFSCFQAGFTASAVSMRQRAMDACKDLPDDAKNLALTAIGSLPDIPE